MEKNVNIDGKIVVFKSNGSLPIRYRLETQRDFFADIIKMQGIEKDMSGIDFTVFYNVAHVMAKIADPSTPPLMEWLEGFECFDVQQVFTEIQDLLIASFAKTKTPKK